MKNGKYEKWNKKENKVRSEKLNKVLARGRAKINAARESSIHKIWMLSKNKFNDAKIN